MEKNDIIENTGHDAKGAKGFDYQFLYFINRLLKMADKRDDVSYEKYDDVSMSSEEGLVYFQLKHTIGGRNQKTVNLSLRDYDLWKTLAVWIDITNKQDEDKRIDFLESNSFVLVTNKNPVNNPFWMELQKYQKGEMSFDELKKFYTKVYDETGESKRKEVNGQKGKTTKGYIKCLIDFDYADQLLKSMSICFEPDLKKEILESLELNKNIPHKNVEEAYQELLGMIRDKYYSDQKDSYTREEFSKVFDRICQKYRERKFTFKRNTMTKLPPHLEDQVFIKQLMDVEDISLEDDPLIVEYTMEKFDYINSIRVATKNDDVSEEEVENVRADAVRYWRQKYKHYMGRINPDDNDKIIEKASDLLNDIRDKNIYFVEKEIESYFSNGCFYYLSDKDSEHEPQIGWRPGWEEKYKTMDRLYNNEAIVGSVILLLLNSGDMEMARLSIVVPMIINDKLRNRLSRYTDNTIVENVKHCYADLTLNRIYQELLIIEINSLVMLSQADLLLVTKDKISLTDNGKEVIKEIRKNNSKRLKRILKVYNLILNRVNQVSTEQLYKSLNIKL